jgi:hypothetical protein
MTACSRRPEVLRELFEALGNAPGLVAESLARPALVERLLRERYVLDEPEESFEEWWSHERRSTSAELEPPDLSSLEVAAGGGCECVDDTWEIRPGGSIAGRLDHTAVWTGAEMIVWGGHRVGDLSTSTGGRYDPATDNWTATSLRGLRKDGTGTRPCGRVWR